MDTVKSRRSQHTQDTRTALVRAARRLFGDRGYAAVSLDEVCAKARVTKGALYHHFENKQDLFLAVYDQVEEEFLSEGRSAVADDKDFWGALSAAGGAFLDLCCRADIRQIVLDAPAVLGWAATRAAETKYALGQLQDGIQAAVDDGLLESGSPEILANLIFAVFHEAGMTVAAASDPERARAEATTELDRVLLGLRPR